MNIAGSNIVAIKMLATSQLDQNPGPVEIVRLCFIMKITSLTEHYSHEFCMRLIICILYKQSENNELTA